MSRLTHALLRSRYNGLYKYNLYKLYWDYVQSDAHCLDEFSIRAAARKPLGPMLWTLSGEGISIWQHFNLASLYSLSTGTTDGEDWDTLNTITDTLYWLDQYTSYTEFSRLEQTHFGTAYPVFHHALNIPRVLDLFTETLGTYPGVQEFLDTLLPSISTSTPLLSAFDGNFSLGSGTLFEASLIRWIGAHGMAWEAWAKANHPEVFEYPEGAIPKPGGYFTLEADVNREFACFPANLTVVDGIHDLEMPPMAAVTGLTGVFTTSGAPKNNKFFDCATSLRDTTLDDTLNPDFSNMVSEALESQNGFRAEEAGSRIIKSFADLDRNEIGKYQVPATWGRTLYTE